MKFGQKCATLWHIWCKPFDHFLWTFSWKSINPANFGKIDDFSKNDRFWTIQTLPKLVDQVLKTGQTRPLFENLWNFFKKFKNFSEASEKFLESKNFFIKNIFIKKFLKNFFKLFKKIFKKNYFYKKIYKMKTFLTNMTKKIFGALRS